MHPFTCFRPRERDGDERVENEHRCCDEAAEHEEFCHPFAIHLSDNIGREKDEGERENGDGNVETEDKGRYLETKGIGRKERCEVDRKGDEHFLDVALKERWHRKVTLYGKCPAKSTH